MKGLNADSYLESLLRGLEYFGIMRNIVFICSDGAAVIRGE